MQFLDWFVKEQGEEERGRTKTQKRHGGAQKSKPLQPQKRGG